MADDGARRSKPKSQRIQDTFRRAQETQAERKFPNSTGVVPLPPGSRGPKSLYLKREGDSFGFTLRHFIVYPPDSIANDGRHADVGALSAPMDTIFVKRVKDPSPAKQAGLQPGDRLVRVNQVLVTNKTYPQVVTLIQNSPDYLHLLVVPKEDDILQRYFAETAYNPASNQNTSSVLTKRQAAQQHLAQTLVPREFQLDAISWRSLQNSSGYDQRPSLRDRNQRSADNLDLKELTNPSHFPDEPVLGQRPRAQPQVPLYRKMGRRASDGCALSDHEYYPESGVNYNEMKMRTVHKTNYLPSETQNTDLSILRYPNTAGCRLSLDAGRRESSSSLTSSLADGSKDSLSSFDSTSTLTGHETDDSAYLIRMKRNHLRKEEFLKMSSSENPVIQREFYGRPGKLERAMWPPYDPLTPGKPTHQNFQRVKNDIEIERDLLTGGVPVNVPQQTGVKSPNDKSVITAQQIKEAAKAPSDLNRMEELNGSHIAENGEDKRVYPASVQMVHKRARQFESGKPLPEDDPVLGNRTSFYKSELARLSSTRVVPNVTERAQEFEFRSNEPKREIIQKKVQRDNRSLESNDTSEELTPRARARSNSAESWPPAMPHVQSENTKRISRQDAIIDDGNKTKDHQLADADIPQADLPPLIPEPVEHMQFTPSVSITPAPTVLALPTSKAVRPNQLDLDGPVRPARHLKPPTTTIDTPMRRPVSPVIGEDNNPVVVKRRTKNTNLADDERSTRRESYLKATEGSRMHFENDWSDGDVSPQVQRSGSVSGNSSNSSLEKVSGSPVDKDNFGIIREGPLHCKITEIDGKRFSDRSWKPVWAILKGPKFFLHKDKHHQSPIGTSDAVEHSLSNGVDMRATDVRPAEDYTKRKHVLRVSSVNPCRSEFLLQAENAEEFTDWFKALHEQITTNTDAETKFEPQIGSKQQAVPQTVPASTSILVQANSHLSPQPNKSKSSASRNRSPTGQSPVSKTRKPSAVPDPTTSPKAKTWRVRVAKQFRKMQGAGSPTSPTAPEGSTFGVPLDQCLPSINNPHVPRFVEVCTEIVDARGLQTVGIYRVPGNNASIIALTEEVNRNYETVPVDDPRWNDLHVVSSLLKAYFRKIPDSLVTSTLYPHFIRADKIENPEARMKELRRLIKNLPLHNYHTLKHIILHLRNVVINADVNKMEAKNLAIVFGPNIVRPEEDNMETMVNNMTHQCKIVETLLTAAEWFFNEDESESVPIPAILPDAVEESEPPNNQALLLDNISKYEALKDKEKNNALFSSIISAAHRKVKRKSTKGSGSLNESKEEVTSPNGLGGYSSGSFSQSDLKDSVDGKTNIIPTTVTDMEKVNKRPEKVPWFNYSTDKEEFHRRIENFKQETEAMLQMPRNVEISVNSIASKSSSLASSVGSVNQTTRLSTKPVDAHLLKTHSASNVFTRTINVENSRHSLDNSYPMQYLEKNSSSDFGTNLRYNNDRDTNRNLENATGKCVIRRGSSVENVTSSSVDLNANGTTKKGKYENEGEVGQRMGSLDSLNKMVPIDDDTDLVTALTTLYDKKLLETNNSCENLLAGEDLPYADESPEKTQQHITPPHSDEEDMPHETDSYRNPSLHKSQYSSKSNFFRWDDTKTKELNEDTEKDEDSTMTADNVRDKENHISSNKLNKSKNTVNSKVKRSESLNKETTVSPLNNKLKRSESLNKTGDKVKRSDSLTKTEKTESNLNKRRELAASTRRSKEVPKLKRKNGMPDRSIKRRHTVGGTKDPDKVTWLDNKYQEEVNSNKENNEKNLRTSSPDLSSTRREKLCLEVNLIGPENMVVALKQHLMGARPQSFPDAGIFKVPLESHV